MKTVLVAIATLLLSSGQSMAEMYKIVCDHDDPDYNITLVINADKIKTLYYSLCTEVTKAQINPSVISIECNLDVQKSFITIDRYSGQSKVEVISLKQQYSTHYGSCRKLDAPKF